MKSAVVAIALTLAVSAASGNEYSKAKGKVTNNLPSLSSAEMLTEPGNDEICKGLFAYDAYLAKESEKALELENWMKNENNFLAFAYAENTTEKPLEVEEWMTDESYFYSPSNLEIAMEELFERESRMKNENLLISVLPLKNETEKPLEVENWMLYNKLYEINNKKAEKEEKRYEKMSAKSAGTSTGEKRFGTRTFFLMEVKDSELKVEQWMLDYRLWNVK